MDKQQKGGDVVMETELNMKDSGWSLIMAILNDCKYMYMQILKASVKGRTDSKGRNVYYIFLSW